MTIAMRRILSVLLCLSVLLSMLLVPVSAASRTGDEKDRGGFVTERTHEQKAKRSACTAEGGEHSFDENGLCTVCGEPSPDAVALVSKNGISIKAYTSLDSAVSAVSSATASDEAVVMLLCSVDLNEDDLAIYSGVFTIDLNGCEISNTSTDLGVLYISGADADVTVTDSGTTGKITTEYTGIDLFNGTLTISGGTISAQFGIDAYNGSITVNDGTISAQYGINAYDCDVNIDGGTIESTGFAVFANNSSVDITKGTVSGSIYGVYASSNTTVTLSGGTIIGGWGIQAENDTVTVSITGGTISTSSYAVNAFGSTVTLSGGIIDTDYYDLNLEGCNATLTLGENGTGATFPGGIKVLNTNLNAILGEGAAYWLGDKMIIPADDATEIIDGDVVVKAVCTHENATKAYTNHGATHTYTYSCCNLEVTEEHSYGESTLTCVCGADGSDAVVMLSKNGTLVKFYTDLQAAITDAEQYTAEDKAELTLLKSVNVGDNELTIWSGTYTLNLGGFTLTSTVASTGAVSIGGNANLIITNGTIEGNNCAIQMNRGKLTLRDLTLKGTAAVRANDGETTVHHCSLEGTSGGLDVNGGSVTVYGGSISGRDFDIDFRSGSVVLCEGITFPGDIIVYNTNLNNILGEGMAYWQGDKMIVPADDATDITGGDVTVKAACTHENATATYEPNGENHLCTYPCCGASFAEDHSSDDAGVVTEPNCTEGGYTTYTCTACGESYKDDYVDALGHSADEGIVTAPTCTEDGYTTYTCTLCGESYTDDVVAALGHSYGEDGNCSVCGHNINNIITINMTDSYGDGWNGNALEVYESGELIATITIENGTTATWTGEYDPEKAYEFYWAKGSYAGECSFEILFGQETVFTATTDDCEFYSDGYCFFTKCEHVYGEGVVTAPTCTEDGYTTYTCTRCGNSYTEDVVTASGHNYGEDGICSVCGHNKNNIITINMTDSYGDGWNGNAIKVYEDGELIDTVTFDDGKTAIWAGDYDPEKAYEFYWVKDNYADECSFGILFGQETVFTATTDDCKSYPDGYRFFPVCEHIYDEGVVTPVTCTEQGYTTYTCTLCGLSYEDDYVDAPGHIKSDDDEGVVTAPTCVDQGYTTYTCITCGESYNDVYVDALGHTKDEGVVTAPTCTDQGYTTYICTVCGSLFYDEHVDALGHTKDEGVVTAPTCDAFGYTTYTCTTCGTSFEDDFVSALGHVLGENGNCTVCGELYSIPVMVAGVQIDYENMADILGDGTASYDADTNTLTLNDFEYDGSSMGVHSKMPLNIVLVGENLITTEDFGMMFEEIFNGDINISGTGSLTINSIKEGIAAYAVNEVSLTLSGSVVITIDSDNNEGIYLKGIDADLLIEDNVIVTIGTEDDPIDAECLYVPAETEGSITITDDATVSVYNTDEEGIYIGGESQTLTISGNATVYIDADEEGIDVGTVIISGGTVTSFGGEDYEGIYAEELTISGGNVTAGTTGTGSPEGDGIEADYIEILGGTVTVTSGGMIAVVTDEDGYQVPGTITLAEGMIIESPESGELGEYDLSENEEGVVSTVLNSDGSFATTLTITVGTGWREIDGNWYYYDPETFEPVTGISRVPYPTEEIDGITYAPDQEAIDYYSGKNETFIDEAEGWFWFNENGVFQSDFSGMIETDDKNVYLENGFAVWNPGLVELDDGYYYFIGDTENGGNKPAVGNYYVGKNNTELEITIGGVYTFDEDGKLCEYNGITDVDGTLYYYEDSQLMQGAGLIATGGNFYYVRSDGSLVVGQKYWVANTNGYKVSVGEYEFADDGRLIFPESTNKNGIYLERGVWYYYENGKKAYGKGLINTTLNWYDENGEAYWDEGGIIYVCSDGRLATGRYYITNVDNFDGTFDAHRGMVLNFNDFGLYVAPKNGIYEIDGVLRYFINDAMQYNSGIIVVDDNYYYVRSNGVVVSNCTYWVTNVGSSGVVAGAYVFDEDGVMQDVKFAGESVLNGIANGYFYENGNIAYNKGLTYLEAEGCYIYVRSNGMVATGKYWITNHNDLLPAGLYDFGEDGKLFR